MKLNYENLVKRGWMHGPDEHTGGENPPAEAPNQTPPEPTPQTSASPPPALSMTQEQFDSAIANAATKALADQRAEQERSQQVVQAREAEARRRQAATQLANPQMDALEAMDLRSDMLEEALLLHPDMPAEARQQLKNDLRAFKTVDQVRAAQDSGLHVKLADAAAGNAIRRGKYTPKNMQQQSVTIEPAHTGVAKTTVPDWYRKEMETEFASMGLKVSEKEIAEAYASERQG